MKEDESCGDPFLHIHAGNPDRRGALALKRFSQAT
jgi:hypothetical protein